MAAQDNGRRRWPGGQRAPHGRSAAGSSAMRRRADGLEERAVVEVLGRLVAFRGGTVGLNAATATSSTGGAATTTRRRHGGGEQVAKSACERVAAAGAIAVGGRWVNGGPGRGAGAMS
jgi:hypothetical protein